MKATRVFAATVRHQHVEPEIADDARRDQRERARQLLHAVDRHDARRRREHLLRERTADERDPKKMRLTMRAAPSYPLRARRVVLVEEVRDEACAEDEAQCVRLPPASRTRSVGRGIATPSPAIAAARIRSRVRPGAPAHPQLRATVLTVPPGALNAKIGGSRPSYARRIAVTPAM